MPSSVPYSPTLSILPPPVAPLLQLTSSVHTPICILMRKNRFIRNIFNQRNKKTHQTSPSLQSMVIGMGWFSSPMAPTRMSHLPTTLMRTGNPPYAPTTMGGDSDGQNDDGKPNHFFRKPATFFIPLWVTISVRFFCLLRVWHFLSAQN